MKSIRKRGPSCHHKSVLDESVGDNARIHGPEQVVSHFTLRHYPGTSALDLEDGVGKQRVLLTTGQGFHTPETSVPHHFPDHIANKV